jgi:hypothetical protein
MAHKAKRLVMTDAKSKSVCINTYVNGVACISRRDKY